jgi:hypothetical protein
MRMAIKSETTGLALSQTTTPNKPPMAIFDAHAT